MVAVLRALLVVLPLIAACSHSQPCKPQWACPPEPPQCERGYVATYCKGQWLCLPPAADQSQCEPWRR
jgi:hypothetical protein